MANNSGGDYNPSAGMQAAQQRAAGTLLQQQDSGLQGYANIAIGDLNSGNYTGALQAGLDSGKLYDTSYGSTTTDPLLQALESGQGLQELDPTKKWDASSIDQYYAAFAANPVTQGKQAGTADAGESWGKNPYGLWGDPTKIAGADAATNLGTQGDNSAPDIERFAGATPTTSFLGKYGADIAALAATALSFGVAAPALAGALAADGVASGLAAGAIAGGVVGAVNTAAVDAITGKPLTLGSVAGGALGGAAGGGLQGLATGAINNATGLGTTVSGGLAGAGLGAARSALTGGNVGLGALTGGIGGAVQGSGVLGNAKSALSGATGLSSNAAGAIVNGGANYAIGGATGLAASALMGGGQPQQRNSGNMAAVNPQTYGNIQGATVSGGAQPPVTMNPGTNIPAAAGFPGAGNATTDQSLASTITGAIPGLLSTGAGVYGAQNAAQAQQTADNSAINTQQSTMGNINNIWGTQAQTGQGANTALQSSLGLNGQPADPSNFLNMPGYQFAVQQGTQAIQRQAASMGSAYTPNTAAAVGQYVTGTASQDYNTYISQLMGAAGLGTTANQGLQTGQQTTGNNISQLQQNIGQAQATGVSSAANAVGGAFGANGAGTSLIGAAGKYLNGSSPSGAGSGGGGGGSLNGSGVYTGTDPGTFGGPSPVSAQNTVGSGYSDNGSTYNGGSDFGFGTTPNTGVPDFGGGDISDSDWTSFLGDGS